MKLLDAHSCHGKHAVNSVNHTLVQQLCCSTFSGYKKCESAAIRKLKHK